MRGKKAKALRQKIYGKSFSPLNRQYIQKENGSIKCTGLRNDYQRLKKES